MLYLFSFVLKSPALGLDFPDHEHFSVETAYYKIFRLIAEFVKGCLYPPALFEKSLVEY